MLHKHVVTGGSNVTSEQKNKKTRVPVNTTENKNAQEKSCNKGLICKIVHKQQNISDKRSETAR